MAARNVEQSIESDLVTAADDGSALLAVVGLERVLGRQLRFNKSDIKRAGGLANEIAKRLHAFLSNDKFLPVRLNMPKDFPRLRDLVAEGFPPELLAQQMSAIADDELKVAFGEKVTNSLEFLAARLPPSLVRSKPSDFMAASFVRAWRTVSDPMTVIGDLEMGCLSNDQVRILQMVFPSLYEMFANAMTAAVIERATDPVYVVPYPKLKQVSILLQQELVSEDLKGLLASSFQASESPSSPKSGPLGSSEQNATKLQKTEFEMKE